MANKIHCDVCDAPTSEGVYKTSRAVNLTRTPRIADASRLPVKVRVDVEVKLMDKSGDVCWMCGLEAIKKLEEVLNE